MSEASNVSRVPEFGTPTFFVIGTVDGEALDWWQFATYEEAAMFSASGDYELVAFEVGHYGWEPGDLEAMEVGSGR